MKNYKKIVVLMFTVMLSAALFVNMTVVSFAADKKYDLPVSVQTFSLERDDDGNIIDNGIWTETERETYKYNKKGHITKYVRTYDSVTTTGKAKWKYKNGKIVRTEFTVQTKSSSYNSKSKSVGFYDKYGRLEKIQSKWTDSSSKKKHSVTNHYKYNKKGWIVEDNNSIMKITYYKNGMPKNVKRIMYFNGVPPIVAGDVFIDASKIGTEAKFNKKGLITESKGKQVPRKFTYTYDKKGRVIICWAKENINGKYVTVYKKEYKYGKNKTADKREYFGIMNRNGYAALISEGAVPKWLTGVD